MTEIAHSELKTEVQITPEGHARVVLTGWLDGESVLKCWNQLVGNLPVAKITTLEVDVAGLQFCDDAGLALLRYLNMGKMTPSASVSMLGLQGEIKDDFQRFTPEDYENFRAPGPKKTCSLPVEVGNEVAQVSTDLRGQVVFLGDVVANLPPTMMSRKRMRWPEVRHIFEQAGANAVPIISLISFLVGLIIAFETSQPLAQFGAQIYVANMIGLIMVRELGPLLAAVLFAGRSGSAFAAEIGTMRVNEELDALQTLGLDPIRFLVVQRIMAAVLLTPLLTLYATFLGITGGVLVAFGLGYKWSLIFHQLTASLRVSDIIFGLTKGVVF